MDGLFLWNLLEIQILINHNKMKLPQGPWKVNSKMELSKDISTKATIFLMWSSRTKVKTIEKRGKKIHSTVRRIDNNHNHNQRIIKVLNQWEYKYELFISILKNNDKAPMHV